LERQRLKASQANSETPISTNNPGLVGHIYNLSYTGGIGRRIASLGKSARSYLENKLKQKGLGHDTSGNGCLSSHPSTAAPLKFITDFFSQVFTAKLSS
jgi:hypothetical protein